MYTLSISKPEEYRFFDISEVSDYFEGKAFVPCSNGKIRVRLEDIVFLKEALRERRTFNEPSCYCLPNYYGYKKTKVQGKEPCEKGVIGLPWGLIDLINSFSHLCYGPFIDNTLVPLALGDVVEMKDSDFSGTPNADRLKCIIFGKTTTQDIYCKPIRIDCPLALTSMMAMYSHLNECTRRFGPSVSLEGSFKTYKRKTIEYYDIINVKSDCKYDSVSDTNTCTYTAETNEDPEKCDEQPQPYDSKGSAGFACSIKMFCGKRRTRIKTGSSTYSHSDNSTSYSYDEPSYKESDHYYLIETITGINPGLLTNDVSLYEYKKGGKIGIYGRFLVTISTGFSTNSYTVAFKIGEGTLSHDYLTTSDCGCKLCYSKITLSSTISTDLHSFVEKILTKLSSLSTLKMMESKILSLANIDYPSKDDIPEPSDFGTRYKENWFSAKIEIKSQKLVFLYDNLTWNTTWRADENSMLQSARTL